ncbi:peptidoglycan editing factor PgeF [Idiomarina tyrosinivorans]|uniref:Purine nucleoside phosphorylase n=1 Tax=Idiomarina tyrosinivorans TaxID=1445662 RepID=A0A432ZSJ4_9GAMM|nr:peptidoglycan editing factor PgeF [Idiomarina tyrosinivorans]RUO80895.1 peptidoglycan editing factor PgeF [Idiomarina tyrosinivorans]
MSNTPAADKVWYPQHPFSANIRVAVTTARLGNLAAHVGDDPASVLLRRRRLQRQLALPSAPRWLQQQHTTRVVDWDQAQPAQVADAIVATQAKAVCAALTADCLPILLATDDARQIAAVHAGWRGLADGVLEHTVARFARYGQPIRAWIGPSICGQCFQVGSDVWQAFTEQNSDFRNDFRQQDSQHWLADLQSIAEKKLLALGVVQVHQAKTCTAHATQAFGFSWRKDQAAARFASLIWRPSVTQT